MAFVWAVISGQQTVSLKISGFALGNVFFCLQVISNKENAKNKGKDVSDIHLGPMFDSFINLPPHPVCDTHVHSSSMFY